MSLKSILVIVFLLFLTQGCTWVELTAEGEKVRILGADEVASCKRIGQTISTTAAKVAGITRHENAIRDELQSLARNSAINLGGDSIVPVSEISEGKQTYDVYRCVPK
jgi:hypothetical protein